MLIPFKDDIPVKVVPPITLAILAVNLYVYVYLLFFSGPGGEVFLEYGAIPANIVSQQNGQPVPPAVTILFSLFMHGGFLHLIINVLFLWIFGNRVENALGHGKFLLFYLFCGYVSIYLYSLTVPASTRPMIGASGAISGILGAYLFLFPGARVHTLLFLGFYARRIAIPAFILISFWAMLQLFFGVIDLLSEVKSNIAWFAHFGGFLAGLVTIKLWLPNHASETAAQDRSAR